MPIETTAVVIGAGPGGLAASQALRTHDIEHVVLERSDSIGSSWRRHYDRLHLHTVKKHSALPGRPFDSSVPKYPSRQQVVDYLDAYTLEFKIAPVFDTTVQRAAHDGSKWNVETDRDRYAAPNLIVATGYNGVPNIPDFEGLDRFKGPVVHTSEYKNGKVFGGQDVLVVGCGNSGAEIVLDLFEHGARPSMVVRGPVHVVPRDMLGRGSQESSIQLAPLPTWLADALSVPLLKLMVGDLTKYGIQRPTEGLRAMIEKYGRVPILDIGTIDLIKRGDADVVCGVTRVDESTVTFADGSTHAYDAIILATGFRCALDRFLEGADRVTNESGRPTVFGREAQIPGLFFIGFRNPHTGALREIALEAPRIARSIQQKVAA